MAKLVDSPKTTVAGIGVALAAIGAALTDGFQPASDMGVIVTAIVVAIMGYLSKDK